LIDIVVRGGSGAGRALAAGPDSSPAATAPAVTPVTQTRLVVLLALGVLLALVVLVALVVLQPRKRTGTSSVTATAPRS
jgi:hypothetical protein